MLLKVGRSYVGNDVTHSTLLDRACACSHENLHKYRSYRVSNTAPRSSRYKCGATIVRFLRGTSGCQAGVKRVSSGCQAASWRTLLVRRRARNDRAPGGASSRRPAPSEPRGRCPSRSAPRSPARARTTRQTQNLERPCEPENIARVLEGITDRLHRIQSRIDTSLNRYIAETHRGRNAIGGGGGGRGVEGRGG